MATSNINSNLNYNQIKKHLSISNEIQTGSKKWYKVIKKAGYKYAYRWINSDDHYMYFANNEARAIEGASKLYSDEAKIDIQTSRKYYNEYIDIFSIDEIIKEWF